MCLAVESPRGDNATIFFGFSFAATTLFRPSLGGDAAQLMFAGEIPSVLMPTRGQARHGPNVGDVRSGSPTKRSFRRGIEQQCND